MSEQCELRILFAGGCHVGGFPVGEELGFAQIAVQDLRKHWVVESGVLQYVNLRSIEKIAAHCELFHPHVLVLQMGNYECPPTWNKFLKKKFHLGSKRKHDSMVSSQLSNAVVSPETHFHPTLSKKISMAAKFAFYMGLAAVQIRVMDPSEIRTQFRALLACIEKLSISHVVVMSPFPAFDYWVDHCRAKVAPVFKEESHKMGFEFLDISTTLRGSYPKSTSLADPIHISADGHRIIGQLLADSLRSTISEKYPDAALAQR